MTTSNVANTFVDSIAEILTNAKVKTINVISVFKLSSKNCSWEHKSYCKLFVNDLYTLNFNKFCKEKMH